MKAPTGVDGMENGLSTLRSVRRVQSWTHRPVVTGRSRAGSLFATDPQWPRVILSTVASLRTRHARVLPKTGLAAAYFRGSEPSSLPRYAR